LELYKCCASCSTQHSNGGSPVNEGRHIVRVKIKIGNMEFEVEAREGYIKNAVEEILSAVMSQGAKGMIEIPTSTAKGKTCKSLIQSLWLEGWFSTPRLLGEVHEELARRGYHYDRTAVAHALVDLVKEGVLTRDGRPRRYRYVQKRPPPIRS